MSQCLATLREFAACMQSDLDMQHHAKTALEAKLKYAQTHAGAYTEEEVKTFKKKLRFINNVCKEIQDILMETNMEIIEEEKKLPTQLDRAAQYNQRVMQARDFSLAQRVHLDFKWTDGVGHNEKLKEQERQDHALAKRLHEEEQIKAAGYSQPSLAERLKQISLAPPAATLSKQVPVAAAVPKLTSKSDFPVLQPKQTKKIAAARAKQEEEDTKVAQEVYRQLQETAAALAKQEEEDRLLAEAIMRAEEEELRKEEEQARLQEEEDKKAAEAAALAQQASEAKWQKVAAPHRRR